MKYIDIYFGLNLLCKEKVKLFDDSHELDPPRIEEDLFEVEQSVLSVSDGYWVVGKIDNLHLPFAPSK